MTRPDLNAKRAEAAQKIEAAKRERSQRKAVKANPPPKYIALPEPTGNAETDSLADLSAVQEAFRRRAADENRRFALATDSEYWACICFQTRAQKEAFLAALNLLRFGDKYLDGQEVATALGVQLPSADVPYKAEVKPDPAWIEFVE